MDSMSIDDPDAYQFHRVPNTPQNQFMGQHLVSDQVSRADIELVWRQLEATLRSDIPGDIVEFGCYVGTTSLFIRRLLDQHKSQRVFHVYDSFEGLPSKQQQDASAAGTAFQPGKLSVSKKEFLQQFRTARLQPPVTHKGWFSELAAETDVPEHIAFAFLDSDFYDSIRDSLKLVWPRMSRGGRLLIDDYHREALPGVDRAVHDFFGGKLPASLQVAHNIAIIEA
jgi:O-methyltransferase